MAEPTGAAWGVIKDALCFCCARAEYFGEVEDDLESLDNLRNRLKQLKEHEDGRAHNELREEAFRVKQWRRRADESEKSAEKIMKEGKEEIQYKACRWCCPKHCCSYNRVGKKIKREIEKIEELIREGSNLDVVVEGRPGDVVTEMPVSGTVGFDSLIEEVWKCIEDPKVNIIGLYGRGGVGKTTLLKNIFNKLKECGKYRVIWVESSKQEYLRKQLRETICKKLGVSEDGQSKYEIWNRLKKVKFALLLDNVGNEWNYKMLEEFGIPLGSDANGSKVIFTTRPENVCHEMKAEKRIEVKCLTREDALKLFRLSVGDSTLNAHREIRKVADDVAELCEGLPLLLVNVGGAMGGNTNPRHWKRKFDQLKNQPSKFLRDIDADARVLHTLKVSYDNLKSEVMKKCFLYLSLFPGDVIEKNEVIEHWISERFLDECGDIYAARDEGNYTILDGLKEASLLLASGQSEDFVKMHDVIRAMNLWLARKEGKAEDNVVVQDRTLDPSKWSKAERISLWGPKIAAPPEQPSCHNLTTLLLRDTGLETLPSEFFRDMNKLRTLDLSDNTSLVELPASIRKLRKLHYLNLSGTSIKTLPPEVQKLKKLQILILEEIQVPLTIAKGVISGLQSLQAFRISLPEEEEEEEVVEVEEENEEKENEKEEEVEKEEVVEQEEEEVEEEKEEKEKEVVEEEGDSRIDLLILEELEGLKDIKEIGIVLSYETFVEKVLKSTHNSLKLLGCIKQLKLKTTRGDCLQKLSLRRMEHLESLELSQCLSLTEVYVDSVPRRQDVFPNLQSVRISGCPIKNLTSLVYASALQSLELIDCDEIAELISKDFGENVFPYLTYLSLRRLPKLKSIFHRALIFPVLQRLLIDGCHNLQSLPFNSEGAVNLKRIEASKIWWDNLEDDTATKQFFSPKLVLLEDPLSEILEYQYYNPHYPKSFNDEDPNACVIQ